MSGMRLLARRPCSSEGGPLYSLNEIALTGFDVVVVYVPQF